MQTLDSSAPTPTPASSKVATPLPKTSRPPHLYPSGQRLERYCRKGRLFELYEGRHTLSISHSFCESFDADAVFKECAIISKAQSCMSSVADQMEQCFRPYLLQWITNPCEATHYLDPTSRFRRPRLSQQALASFSALRTHQNIRLKERMGGI